jgi:small subunit ribosomal protein S6
MNLYETMFVLKPTLTTEETQARVQMIKDVLTSQGAEICATEDWGTKKLAYKVEKHDRGYYYITYFKAEGKSILELERVYKVTEDVIRFMTLKYEKKVEVKAWNQMVDKANGKKSAPVQAAAPVAAPAEVKVEAPAAAVVEAQA